MCVCVSMLTLWSIIEKTRSRSVYTLPSLASCSWIWTQECYIALWTVRKSMPDKNGNKIVVWYVVLQQKTKLERGNTSKLCFHVVGILFTLVLSPLLSIWSLLTCSPLHNSHAYRMMYVLLAVVMFLNPMINFPCFVMDTFFVTRILCM